ncbi:multi antimicrobial extrusion protein [Vibrio ishigakensis]|uniref:Multi antimicrobial extrusion protein n=1 Tax=Vibrio ishigakensis TaxID=1481914 RepID=A0A0B8PHT1_9VIBR|nr:multi antimicrobial extrusion protein [Vibrio ishigakensis]
MQTTESPFSRFSRESGALMHLSIPIIFTQLATQAMGFVDTTMAGQVSAADLAAIALGSSLWIPVLLLLRGIIMALTPVVAFHRGAGNLNRISSESFQMVWIALISSAILIGYLCSARGILEWIAVDPIIIPIASDYAFALAFGVPGIALFYVLNGFFEGMNNTKIPMIVSVIGLLINIPVNYVLIYGKFGFPELGAVGCGWATSLVYWLMSAMLYVCIKTHRQYKSLIDFSDAKPEPKEMLSLFKLGLPIGTNIAVCGSIFAVIALLIGRIGAENVAAAQIALNISSMTYVISMSVSFGITIRVGHALGANNTIGTVERSKIGIMVAGLISLIPATVLLTFPDPIISYTPQTLWLAQLRRDFLFSPLCINLAMPCKPLPMAPYVVTKIPRFLCSYLWPVIGD